MPAARDRTPPRPTPTPPLPATSLPIADPHPADRRERANGVAHAFGAVKAQHASRRTRLQVFADALTRLVSSTAFLVVHLLAFTAWILANVGALRAVGVRPFDPFPFGLLTLVLSIEAIVLTILVLMSQGREAAVAELREELTLQVNLRMESEVTKTLQLLTGLYTRLGLTIGDETELRDMLRPLDAFDIEQQLLVQMEGDDERAGAVRQAVQRAAERLRGEKAREAEPPAAAGDGG